MENTYENYILYNLQDYKLRHKNQNIYKSDPYHQGQGLTNFHAKTNFSDGNLSRNNPVNKRNGSGRGRVNYYSTNNLQNYHNYPNNINSYGRGNNNIDVNNTYGKNIHISMNKNVVPINDSNIEQEVVRTSIDILQNAAAKTLKAVELANTLRARLGTKTLARVRDKYGGLLFLLERYRIFFRVNRIPKNDSVSLLSETSKGYS